MGEVRRLTVERLGHRGDGVAGDVFVPGSLPGEQVEGEVEKGRMSAPRILAPAPMRVRPPCPHAKACGGCALQHASDAFLRAWKAEVVRGALAAQGLAAPIRAVHVSLPASRRRAVLHGRRTKRGATVGFHGRASDVITAVPECRVLDPRIVAALRALAALVEAGASRRARLDIAVIASESGLDVAVTGGGVLDAARRARLAGLAMEAGLARLSWEGEPLAMARAPLVRFDGIAVEPPPGAFLQATAEGEAALRACVAAAVGEARRVADLFAGCGTFALPLARRAEVLAVEGDPALVAALEAGWRGAGGALRPVTVVRRDLFRRPLTPPELARFEAVVIDPPRAGAEAQARALAESPVQAVAAVSCNPVTFARDARILVAGGFSLDWIEVVDQFRWSPHVELVARLSRQGRS
ncbi:23S rRNA (uracil1939-C5)-methyltransferase [Meinhardsimonia xiamenensis]|jgi:23S rRNA (uracil1939-C5)-methyltransferase|uniref:23S rRNA (Uracil1939-C5)-methyltransferase n=1 Tax=Meinhardsimonia xiamenensis TaxID=990712 RepID=A0A1G8XYX7_9RHOB|nr:class I SAM-dependent RNA methyltransferase [Meinhardsimonia xiamenensis]PRX37100.1 23S rRNA m(5)U-1939 methyltransferase [Meinhardsimonia xiamenensis]SDJ95717.1 23S rRNA (uracil1939-C5)-methyltransferase [Meinhardsimonia xiamenensis]